MNKSIFTLGIFVLAATSVMAQEENEFSIDAQLRTRGEYNHGAINPRDEGENGATFFNNRARLSMGWKRSNLELKASVQHTGVWGQDDIKDRNGRVAMNEAWGKIYFGRKNNQHYFQVGRQQLSYDDERILGGLDWNVAGNWHDAIRYGWETNYGTYKDNLNLVVAYNQESENKRGNVYTGPMPYKYLYMARYNVAFDTTPLSWSLLGMSVGREAGTTTADTKYLRLLGTDISFKPGDFDIHADFYYEFGKDRLDRTMAAWMASGRLGYNITEQWNVNVAYDYLSGSDGTDEKNKTFDPLFGTHHKFLGAMDFFTAIPTQGLSDIQAGLGCKAVRGLNMKLNYHYFMLNNKIGDLKKELGHELDFQVSGKLQKDVTLTAGYSFMLGTETMDAVKGGSHDTWQDWAFVQLNINPRVFFAKW